MKEIVIAADLGGTNLRMAAVDERGAILFRTKRETPHGEHAGEIVRAIAESAKECRKLCRFRGQSSCGGSSRDGRRRAAA